MKRIGWILCALGALATGVPAGAQKLYGATAGGNPGELYVLDAATGAMVQDVGALSDVAGTRYSVTGLAYDAGSGKLFGSSGNGFGPAAKLVTVDPLTALVTEIGSFNGPPDPAHPGKSATMGDLSFDPISGGLYGVGTVGGPQLYTINTTTGAATVVGSTGFTSTTGGGLAFDASGQAYGTPTSTRFGTYDKATGAYTNIGSPAKPVGGGFAAMTFDDAGKLLGLNLGAGNATHLMRLDPLTGASTDLGVSINSLDAIAFVPGGGGAVPEPGSMALLLGPGLLGVLGVIRRRR
jgi:hypothetical protein